MTDPGPPLPPQTDSAATGRPLFRPEVLAAKSDFLGQIIIARPPGVLLYTLVAAAALAMFVTALLVIQVPNVRAFPGWVEPSGSQLRVEAPTTGSISRVLMSQGSQATSGQPLVELSTERTLASGPDVSAVILQSLRVQKRQLEDRMRLVAETYDGQRRELEAQKAGLGAQLASGSQQLALAQQRLVLAERQATQMRTLAERGYAAGIELARREEAAIAAASEVEAAGARIAAAKSSQAELDARIAALPTRREVDLLILRQSIQDIDQALVRAEIEGTVVVVSPASGRVASINVSPGETVPAGYMLAAIQPDASSFNVRLLASPADTTRLQVGDSVRVRISAFPNETFGDLEGSIISIGGTPVAEGDVRIPLKIDSPVYLVTVSLTRSTNAQDSRLRQLVSALPVEGIFTESTRTLWRVIFQPRSASGR